MKTKTTYNPTSRPEGVKSLAQGNALCREYPYQYQAPKGRNQNDVALYSASPRLSRAFALDELASLGSGLNKMVVSSIRRALPYANDNKAFSLIGTILANNPTSYPAPCTPYPVLDSKGIPVYAGMTIKN